MCGRDEGTRSSLRSLHRRLRCVARLTLCDPFLATLLGLLVVVRCKQEMEPPLSTPSAILGCSYSDDQDRHDWNEELSFETDHEALRGNKDYLALLRTMALLQAQRIQAIRDTELLLEARNKALSNPLEFVAKLQQGQTLNLPGSQRVAQLPFINWDQYNLPSLHSLMPGPSSRHDCLREEVATVDAGSSGAKVERNSKGQYLVRGRLFDPKSKPTTFNQPWTTEEQRRLEQLLLTYPSEEVEMERWKKIATALGNRTPIQVQSRVQKYFMKLQKAGLPIPGKSGKHLRNSRFAGSSVGRRLASGASASSVKVSRNCTFFPDLKPSVKMTEEEEKIADDFADTSFSAAAGGLDQEMALKETDDYYYDDVGVSDEEGIAEDVKGSSEYLELMWLKRVRQEMELYSRHRNRRRAHHGFKCDGCGQEPIRGPRFHCMDCSEDSVDFCSECVVKNAQFGGPGHTAEHAIKAARPKHAFDAADQDYLLARGNYLDTNYFQ